MTAFSAFSNAAPEGRPLRVLVVDDSAYMRHVITKGLSAAAGVTVVGPRMTGARRWK